MIVSVHQNMDFTISKLSYLFISSKCQAIRRNWSANCIEDIYIFQIVFLFADWHLKLLSNFEVVPL